MFGMGQAATIEISSRKGPNPRDLREDFKRKWGHPFDRHGYKGHPFFDYNCRGCGVHISLVRPKRWFEAEKHGNFPGLALPAFAGLKAGK
jgi:hypothetical protein